MFGLVHARGAPPKRPVSKRPSWVTVASVHSVESGTTAPATGAPSSTRASRAAAVLGFSTSTCAGVPQNWMPRNDCDVLLTIVKS